ncbi:MAG: Tex-like N-terminal domain-containing protein, partial [Spirochaeta sp.]
MATAQKILDRVSIETGITASQVVSTAALLDEGATVPFIARYRKERTGGLEDVQIISIRDWITRLTELENRRSTILNSIREQDKLTAELEKAIMAAASLTVLEDLYLPYRQKRRTRATVARERGLEPLAERIFAQRGGDPAVWAAD